MTTQQKTDEKILVIKKEKLFFGAIVTGFEPMKSFTPFQDIINSNKEFLWRSAMETNISYKQVIPYLIFCYKDKYFLMQRKGSASEQRLKNKYTLGIGGHIRQEDIQNNDIIDWANREFHEEVAFDGKLNIKPLGIINDDSSPVGQVHTGFAFLLEGNSANISVRSELKQGNLLPLDECEQHYENMETWSQLVFDFLKSSLKNQKQNI